MHARKLFPSALILILLLTFLITQPLPARADSPVRLGANIITTSSKMVANGRIDYRASVTNVENVNLSNIPFTLTFSEGSQQVVLAPPVNVRLNPSNPNSPHIITGIITTLNARQTVDLPIQVGRAPAASSLNARIEISPPDGYSAATPETFHANANIVLDNVVKIRVSQIQDHERLSPEEKRTYTVSIENFGDVPLFDVPVSDRYDKKEGSTILPDTEHNLWRFGEVEAFYNCIQEKSINATCPTKGPGGEWHHMQWHKWKLTEQDYGFIFGRSTRGQYNIDLPAHSKITFEITVQHSNTCFTRLETTNKLWVNTDAFLRGLELSTDSVTSIELEGTLEGEKTPDCELPKVDLRKSVDRTDVLLDSPEPVTYTLTMKNIGDKDIAKYTVQDDLFITFLGYSVSSTENISPSWHITCDPASTAPCPSWITSSGLSGQGHQPLRYKDVALGKGESLILKVVVTYRYVEPAHCIPNGEARVSNHLMGDRRAFVGNKLWKVDGKTVDNADMKIKGKACPKTEEPEIPKKKVRVQKILEDASSYPLTPRPGSDVYSYGISGSQVKFSPAQQLPTGTYGKPQSYLVTYTNEEEIPLDVLLIDSFAFREAGTESLSSSDVAGDFSFECVPSLSSAPCPENLSGHVAPRSKHFFLRTTRLPRQEMMQVPVTLPPKSSLVVRVRFTVSLSTPQKCHQPRVLQNLPRAVSSKPKEYALDKRFSESDRFNRNNVDVFVNLSGHDLVTVMTVEDPLHPGGSPRSGNPITVKTLIKNTTGCSDALEVPVRIQIPEGAIKVSRDAMVSVACLDTKGQQAPTQTCWPDGKAPQISWDPTAQQVNGTIPHLISGAQVRLSVGGTAIPLPPGPATVKMKALLTDDEGKGARGETRTDNDSPDYTFTMVSQTTRVNAIHRVTGAPHGIGPLVFTGKLACSITGTRSADMTLPTGHTQVQRNWPTTTELSPVAGETCALSELTPPTLPPGYTWDPASPTGENCSSPVDLSPDPARNSLECTWKVVKDPTASLVWSKVDADNVNLLLPHSEWELNGPSIARKIVKDCVSAPCSAAFGDTDPARGVFKVPGLRSGTYTLTEKKAPAGYVRLEHPLTLEVRVTDGVLEPVHVPHGFPKVANEKHTMPAIPLTGGNASDLFLALGGFFVIVSLVLAHWGRRRMSAALR